MPRTRSLAWSELKLGIVGIAAIVLATMMILAVGGEAGFFADRYPLKTRFRDVQGLKPGAVVRLGGKEVGLVDSVEFVGAEIEIVFEVRSDLRPLITDEATATIGSLSLLGEPVIDLRATGQGRPLEDWAYVHATGSGGPFGGLTETASSSLEQAGQLLADVRAGHGTLGKLVTDDALYKELEQFIQSASAVTQAINRGRGTVGTLMNDPAAANALKASLENLQATTARINAGQGALGRFLNDEAMGKSLASTMTNMEEVTAKMNTGRGTAGRLMNDAELYDKLNSMANRVDQVVAGLESGKGTAGQLLQDRQLYETMNGTIKELQALLADIRKDPKKFLRVSVSIF